MKGHKIKNLLDQEVTQKSVFRTKNWIETNDDAIGACNTNNQIEFKTTMLKLSLCDYSDAFILVKERITITGAEAVQL